MWGLISRHTNPTVKTRLFEEFRVTPNHKGKNCIRLAKRVKQSPENAAEKIKSNV